MELSSQKAFAIWVTGLPASGKSTLVASLKAQLADRKINVAVLESDVLRKIFTPHPTYSEEERDFFYRQMVYVGTLLTQHGVPVIFDATANRRVYRDRARREIPQFMEVYLDCPLDLCMARDPKGIYRDAGGGSNNVPGLHAAYEAPENPDVIVRAGEESSEITAKRVMARLQEKGYFRD